MTDIYRVGVHDDLDDRGLVDEMADTERHDLDETRRLLYMVLLGGLATERWFNLAGTLTNALAHHSKLATAAEVMENLTYIRAADVAFEDVTAEARVLSDDAIAWVKGLINGITEQLDAT